MACTIALQLTRFFSDIFDERLEVNGAVARVIDYDLRKSLEWTVLLDHYYI